jgi:hypothetical protein
LQNCCDAGKQILLSANSLRILAQKILQKLSKRARAAFNAFQAGIVEPRSSDPSQPDELEILGGRNSLITMPTRSSPRSTPDRGDALMSFFAQYGTRSDEWYPPPAAQQPYYGDEYGPIIHSQDEIWRNFVSEFGLEG